MQSETIKYLLFFAFIFYYPSLELPEKLIPVKKPEISYSKDTTWLLNENNKSLKFNEVFNKHFEKELSSTINSATLFAPIFNIPSLTPETIKTLKTYNFNTNLSLIIPKVDMSGLKQTIKEYSIKNVNFEKFFNSIKESDKKKVYEYIDSINIPLDMAIFFIPLLESHIDREVIQNNITNYLIFLATYANNDEAKLLKVLQHCRLLSNCGDSYIIYLATVAYYYALHHSNINFQQYNEISKKLPPWVNLQNYFEIQFRAEILTTILQNNIQLNELLQKKVGKDLFIDSNSILKNFNEFLSKFRGDEYDKPIKGLKTISIIRLSNYLSDLNAINKDKPLAQRVIEWDSVQQSTANYNQEIFNNILQLNVSFVTQASKLHKLNNLAINRK